MALPPIELIGALPHPKFSAGTEFKTTMNHHKLIRLGLVAALAVLAIGAILAFLKIHGAFEVIWASLIAIGLLISTIARRASPKPRIR